MDFIQPIGPVDRDIDPVSRVARANDEREEREQQQKKDEQAAAGRGQEEAQPEPPQGPVEGDDGHLHIDIRA